MSVTVKRVYDDPSPDDGARVLVDRLWPRGVRKDDVDAVWEKDVAPSKELREAFHAGDLSFADFRARYEAELDDAADAIGRLRSLEEEHGTLTLLTATKDEEHNHALVLRDLLAGGGR